MDAAITSSYDLAELLRSILNAAVTLAALLLIYYVAKRGLDALMLWIKINERPTPPPIVAKPKKTRLS